MIVSIANPKAKVVIDGIIPHGNFYGKTDDGKYVNLGPVIQVVPREIKPVGIIFVDPIVRTHDPEMIRFIQETAKCSQKFAHGVDVEMELDGRLATFPLVTRMTRRLIPVLLQARYYRIILTLATLMHREFQWYTPEVWFHSNYASINPPKPTCEHCCGDDCELCS